MTNTQPNANLRASITPPSNSLRRILLPMEFSKMAEEQELEKTLKSRLYSQPKAFSSHCEPIANSIKRKTSKENLLKVNIKTSTL